jgi:FkbM family methyltransferase
MRALIVQAGIVAPVIFDVGAHFGNVTAYFLKMFPAGHVYCFEPEPLSLERLYKRYGNEERVTIIPSALGSRQGTAKFHICGQNTEMSSLLPRSEHLSRRYYRHDVRETIEVNVETLDRAKFALGVDTVHLLKVDVQGGEKMVFRGAKDALAAGDIWAIYSEVLWVQLYKGAAMFWELCRQLDKYDMTIFDIYGLQRSWINRQLKYGDALWIGPTLRALANDYPEEWLRKSLEHRMCPSR